MGWSRAYATMRASQGRSSARWAQRPKEVRRRGSQNDVQWWSLVIGLGVFVAVIAVTFVRRQIRERRDGPSSSSGEFVVTRRQPEPAADAPVVDKPTRRRPVAPPPPGEPRELVSAIRSSI